MQEVILHVTGMMCPHCEATVKKCLEIFPEVEQAIPNCQENKVVLYINENNLANLEGMKQAIVKAGYQVED